MTLENKEVQVCDQCPNHCPVTELRCPRGRRAMLGENQAEQIEYDGHHGHGEQGGHGYRGEYHGHGEHGGRGERGGRGEHSGRGEHGGHHRHGGHPGEHGGHGRGFDEDSLSGLMQACGHHLHHRGRHGGGQDGILAILAERENMSQKKLQEILKVQPGSMSEILTKLEQKGMIIRKKDADDKRKCNVSLTETGKAAIKQQEPRMDEKDMFDILSEEEQTELKKLLKKLLDSWKGQK